MSDAVTETVGFGGQVPEPRRRRLVVVAAIAAALALVVVAAVESHAGWFDSKTKPTAQIADPLPSTPRALTAAVLSHIPDGVTVAWSTAAADLGKGMPGIGPAVGLRKSMIASVLMKVDSEEFFLMVITGPPNQELVPDSLAHGLITRDKQGREINEMVAGSANGNPTLITESASPRSHGELPLSDAELKAILADPLVGVQTDTATLARAKTLVSYTESPPPLTWEP